MRCAVRGCKSKSKRNETSNISFYSIPKDPELCKIWVEFCRRPQHNLNPKTARICSEHFRAKDKERNLQYEMGFQKFKCPKLKPGTVPCIYKLADTDDEDAEEKKNDLLSFPTVMLNEDSENSEQLLSDEEKDPGKDPLDAEEEKKKFNIKYVTLNGKQMICPATITDKPNTEAPSPQQNFKGILAVLYPVDGAGKAVQGLLVDSSKKQGFNVNPVPVQTKTDPNEDFLSIQKLKNENKLLKENEMRHKEQIRELEMSLMRSNFLRNDLETKLKTVFSSNQIRQLKSGRRVIWAEKDMAQAVKLYQTSPAAYRLLKDQNYPLPSTKSVQTWIQMCKQQLRQMENSTDLDAQQNEITEEFEIEPEQQNTDNQNYIIPTVMADHDYFLVVD